VPTPAPSPTNFNTTEYRAGRGLASINALTAYAAGATGQGITVGVIDSGIDLNSAEFAGRIHPNSFNVNGGTLQDPDGHGTEVASFIGANKNDSGTHGVAFNSTLFIARTDDGCSTECQHNDNDIATGVNSAVQNGARIINISLGGSGPNRTLITAINNATARGVIIVFSAGNEYDASTGVGSNPDPLPQYYFDTNSDRGLIIIAGATNANAVITSFSNRAGTTRSRNFFLEAPGSGLIAPTVPGDGEACDGIRFTCGGTSFAAPHIAGALALVLQAFPGLTSQQAVDLLLTTATDTGAVGTDDINGRGFLNIGKAFQPQGSQSVIAGQTGASISVAQVQAVLGSGFGDGAKLGAALGNVVFLDGYGRPFAADFSRQITSRKPEAGVRGLLQEWQAAEQSGIATQAVSVAVAAQRQPFAQLKLQNETASPKWRGIKTHAAFALSPQSKLHIVQGYDVLDVTKSIGGQSRFALSAASAAQSTPDFGLGLTQNTGNWRVSYGASQARTRPLAAFSGNAARRLPEGFMSSAGLAVERLGDALAFGVTVRATRERNSLLGTFAGDGLALARASRSTTLESSLSWKISPDVRVTATGTLGRLWSGQAQNSLIESVSGLLTTAASLTAEWANAFRAGDTVGVRIAQPLRVEKGSAQLLLPVAYDYRTLGLVYDRSRVSLAPDAREISLEASYAVPLEAFGDVQFNIFQRFNPGHQSGYGDDLGVVARWRMAF
jgi:Subtilase family